MRTILIIQLSVMLAAPLMGEVTYSRDIAPIIQENCAGCHRPGEAAPFALLSYDDVRRRARTVLAAVSDRYMPPWQAVGGDVPIIGERRLRASEITAIREWVENGRPEGNPDDLPEAREFPDGWTLGKPDLVLEMKEAYALPADGPDIYRNFVIPTGLKERRWLKAIEFRAGSPAIVHHSLYYLDTTGAAVRADARDPVPGFAEMPFGEGVGKFLGGWAPGMIPIPLPEGLAYELPKDSDIILSTHFHPSGKKESERSTIGLYFGDKPPEKEFLVVQLPPVFGAFAGIDLAPGAKENVVTDSFELPVDVEAFGATAHAHYLGKSLRLAANLPDGSEMILLNIPEWDFSWQEEYRFEEPVRLPAGTHLVSTVTWDNSTENPLNPADPPVRVRWGRESFDEMGSLSLMVTAANAKGHRVLRRAYSDHLRWQVGGHILSPEKLDFAAGLRRNALRKFDADADGRLDIHERAKAKEFLKSQAASTAR